MRRRRLSVIARQGRQPAAQDALRARPGTSVGSAAAHGGGGGAAAGVSGGNGESSSLAHLASELELHAAILDRLHMEKAEDVNATMEKLKHLILTMT